MRGNLLLYRMTPSNPFHDYPLPNNSHLNLVQICILDQLWSPIKRKRNRVESEECGSIKFRYCPVLSWSLTIFEILPQIPEEIDFDFGHFRKFGGPWPSPWPLMTLKVIFLRMSRRPSPLSHIGLWLHFVWLWTDGWTDMFSLMVWVISAHQQRWLKIPCGFQQLPP